MELLGELKKKLNTAIILVTHDLGVVANFADRIQVMYAGQVIERGTAKEIFYNAKHHIPGHYYHQFQDWILKIKKICML